MDELKNLLEALKNNIDPKLQAQLLDIFEILDEENKASIITALKEGLQQKKVIEKYEDKHKEAVTVSVKKTGEIEKRSEAKQKEATKAYEAEHSSGDSKAADDMLNQL